MERMPNAIMYTGMFRKKKNIKSIGANDRTFAACTLLLFQFIVSCNKYITVFSHMIYVN